MSQSERNTSIGMLCPACKVDLVMAERQNIEIDYCPKCRGIWLDRGELDKIIEKSLAQPPEQPVASQPLADPGQQGHHGGYGKHGYRRKSWLQEIFD
jgi:Zn-finger nucleic acid-binding protein